MLFLGSIPLCSVCCGPVRQSCCDLWSSFISRQKVVILIDDASEDVVMKLANSVTMVAYLIIEELYLHGLSHQIKRRAQAL